MPPHWRLTSQKKIQLTENDVEEACLDVLRWHHFYPLRQQSGRFIMPDREVIDTLEGAGVPFRWQTVGEKGIPDYVIPRFFVEVKAPGGVVSLVQRRKIQELALNHLETAVPRSVEEMVAWLDEHEAPIWKP